MEVWTALGGRSAGATITLGVRWERTMPSDDEAIPRQLPEPALVRCVQVAPESVDV